MSIPYTLIRTSRKTIQIEIDRMGEVIVRAPRRISRVQVNRFLAEKAEWIQTHAQAQAARHAQRRVVPDEEVTELQQKATQEMRNLTIKWANAMGVKFTTVRITSAARRWGSCSSRGGICYSWRIMLLPPELREYIVVHELSHIRVRNHSSMFYAEVEKWMPDYKKRIQQLHAFERMNLIDTE